LHSLTVEKAQEIIEHGQEFLEAAEKLIAEGAE
jgi:hypothetical protein